MFREVLMEGGQGKVKGAGTGDGCLGRAWFDLRGGGGGEGKGSGG